MSDIIVKKSKVDELLDNAEILVETKFDKVTVVIVKLENGFTFVEGTGCVDPANYSEEIGKEICLDRVRNKLWMLEGYKLQCEVGDI